MLAVTITAGFLVGLLTGMTGMGGGLIMTPVLIFLLGVSPATAVGTDLIYASVTKLFGAWQHWRQKTIDFTVVQWLTAGSLPGALAGVWVVMELQNRLNLQQVNSIIGKMLGIAYMAIAVLMLWHIIQKRRKQNISAAPQGVPKGRLILLGFVGGLLVATTSIGSGTLFMAMLLLIYPISAARLVGTDIMQAVFVTGVAGLGHFYIGNVDSWLVVSLLAGSIPGILLGSRLTTRLPEIAIRTGLLIMLLASGMKLLH